MDDVGYLKTSGLSTATNIPGVFACGDVRLSPVKRVASAVGEGSMAIALIHQYLQRAGEDASQR